MDTLVGQSFANKQGREYIVDSLDPVRRSKKKIYHIRFTDSGYTTTAQSTDIQHGLIRDKLQPTTYGVACLGFATLVGNEPAYYRWHAMLTRCYDSTHNYYHNYGGAGVTVCERWLRFDYFLEDFPLIEGYNKEKFEAGLLHLDKDIKQKHIPKSERVYSLDTCKLVSKQENDNHREEFNTHLRHSFIALSPEQKEYTASGIRAFAREHQLNPTAISQCLKGKAQSHRGWRFKPTYSDGG